MSIKSVLVFRIMGISMYIDVHSSIIHNQMPTNGWVVQQNIIYIYNIDIIYIEYII